MAQAYSYEALDPRDRSLRLLEFLDDTGTSFALKSFALESAPVYITLSYRWSAPADRSIAINNCSFLVGESLLLALKALARQVRAEEGLFWVDAICINQNDTLERAAQVKIMKDIYVQSDRVFAWLGNPPNDEETRLGVELMCQLRDDVETHWKGNGHSMAAMHDLVHVEHWAFPKTLDSHMLKAWAGITDILTCPYWERTWIYQEATTPVSLDYFVGQYNFSSLDLFPTIHFAEFAQILPGELQDMFQKLSYGGSAHQIHMARIARSNDVPRTLLDLLYEMKTTSATDPRDKIYACLGHASNAETQPAIKIDYDRAMIDVYIDLVAFSLANWQISPLEFLAFTSIPVHDSASRYQREIFEPTIPSWVPDWRRRSNPSGISTLTPDGSSLPALNAM